MVCCAVAQRIFLHTIVNLDHAGFMTRTKRDVSTIANERVRSYSPGALTKDRETENGIPTVTTSPSDVKLLVLPDLNLPEGVTSIGRTFTIKGTLFANEHLIFDGKLEGTIIAPKHDVAVSQHANVRADIKAKTVTVLGSTVGTLNASNRVELRASANVRGTIIAPRVAITGGSKFEGSVASRRSIPTDKTLPTDS